MNKSQLYRALANSSGQWPTWNFWKYLIDQHGNLIKGSGFHNKK